MADAVGARLMLAYCVAAAAALALAPPAAIAFPCLAPLVLFAPGYALVRALDPPANPRPAPDRWLLAVTLSLAVVSLSGLALNWAFSLTRIAWGASLLALTAIASAVGLLRQRFARQSGAFLDRGASKRRRLRPRITAIGAVGIAAAAVGGAIAITEISARTWYRTPLTELSLQGTGANALRVSVSNRSGSRRSYRLRVVAGGYVLDSFLLELPSAGTWSQTLPTLGPVTATLAGTAASRATHEEVTWNG